LLITLFCCRLWQAGGWLGRVFMLEFGITGIDRCGSNSAQTGRALYVTLVEDINSRLTLAAVVSALSPEPSSAALLYTAAYKTMSV
jgi:hypothetical protein